MQSGVQVSQDKEDKRVVDGEMRLLDAAARHSTTR